MHFKKAKIILNPASDHGETQKLVSEIKNLWKLGIPFELAITQKPKDAEKMAKKVKGFDLLVVVGGDGTIHEAINGLMSLKERKVTLAIIPSGSGNDFARMLNLPLKISEAIKKIGDGKVKYVDVGKVNEKYYINSLGIGFDARVAHLANEIKSKIKKSGLSLYLVSLFHILLKDFHTHRVEISFDGENFIQKNITLIAANLGRTYGGGFKITPLAQNDDGFIDVCMVDSLKWYQVLPRLPFVIIGKHLWMKEVHYYKARELIVKSEEELPAHSDGELIKASEFKIKILPKALKVVVGKD